MPTPEFQRLFYQKPKVSPVCGRYHITRPLEAVAEVFDAVVPEEIREAAEQTLPRYNIAPTHMVPVIRLDDEGPYRGKRIVDFAHWGLVPGWAKDTSMATKMFNARSETVAEKPSFRAAFRHRRCLIPTSGFYEWKTENPGTSKAVKQPHRIYFRDERMMVMAGLFEVWSHPNGSALGSCSMITAQASPAMDGLHARMPVVLDSEDEWDLWLSPKSDSELLHALMQSYEGPDFVHHPVSRDVGNVRNENVALLHPIETDAAPNLPNSDIKPAQASLF